MNKIKFILVLGVLFVTSSFHLSAQNQSDMRLSEILVTNTSDFQDNFGQFNPWIELFNSSYGTVNIAGCFLSNDPENLTLYSIPKGDITTKIPPRQYTLFWANSQPKHGIFHTNFTVKAGETIFFVASDGKTIIDSIELPSQIESNVSFGFNNESESWSILPNTSPRTVNVTINDKSKSDIMLETDPTGGIMALTAMSVVFLALIILYALFRFIGFVAIYNQRRKAKETIAPNNTKIVVKDASSEEFAAISMALYLYEEENNSHDDESLTITMVHTDRQYSPWNSKIYGLRHVPELKK